MRINIYINNEDDSIRFCEKCNYQVALGEDCSNCESEEPEDVTPINQLSQVFQDFKTIFSLQK